MGTASKTCADNGRRDSDAATPAGLRARGVVATKLGRTSSGHVRSILGSGTRARTSGLGQPSRRRACAHSRADMASSAGLVAVRPTESDGGRTVRLRDAVPSIAGAAGANDPEAVASPSGRSRSRGPERPAEGQRPAVGRPGPGVAPERAAEPLQGRRADIRQNTIEALREQHRALTASIKNVRREVHNASRRRQRVIAKLRNLDTQSVIAVLMDRGLRSEPGAPVVPEAEPPAEAPRRIDAAAAAALAAPDDGAPESAPSEAPSDAEASDAEASAGGAASSASAVLPADDVAPAASGDASPPAGAVDNDDIGN